MEGHAWKVSIYVWHVSIECSGWHHHSDWSRSSRTQSPILCPPKHGCTHRQWEKYFGQPPRSEGDPKGWLILHVRPFFYSYVYVLLPNGTILTSCAHREAPGCSGVPHIDSFAVSTISASLSNWSHMTVTWLPAETWICLMSILRTSVTFFKLQPTIYYK